MQEDALRRRIRKLCTKLVLKKMMKTRDSKECPLQRTRTVRSITVTVNPKPVISKHLIHVESDAQRKTSPNILLRMATNETTLDQIIDKLRRDTSVVNTLLLITPASKHPNHYKLHVIDRLNRSHLGMTSITKRELSRLKTSQAFQHYVIVLGTKYIDLKTIVLKSPIIANLSSTLRGNCCPNSLSLIGLRGGQSTEPENTESETGDSAAVPYRKQQQKQQQLQRQRQQVAKGSQKPRPTVCYGSQCDTGLGAASAELAVLIARINIAKEPSEKDLNMFFVLAERYKFKIYVRPELCWKTEPEVVAGEKVHSRFQLDCFMLFDNYVGGIALYAEQLQQQLKQHQNLLPRVHVIDDVCEITPLPRTLCLCIRTVCEWLGMELLYDAFGEFVFDWCKQNT